LIFVSFYQEKEKSLPGQGIVTTCEVLDEGTVSMLNIDAVLKDSFAALIAGR
jgi:hypothetical protein